MLTTEQAVQPPLFAQLTMPSSPINAVLLQCAEHFERMSEREHANGNHARAEALRDCSLYLRQNMEGTKS